MVCIDAHPGRASYALIEASIRIVKMGSGMNTRRELSKSYKERTQRGGVYTIANTVNGKYILGYAADLASVANRFQFAVQMNSAVDPRLRADWLALGSDAFELKILEELDKKPDQSRAEFLDDLKTLEGLWRAQLDPTDEY